MANIKYSDTTLVDLIDSLKLLSEDPVTADKFAHITGVKIDAYIKVKILSLLGASKKILRANAANSALEGKTIQEVLLEILTTNNRMLIRDNSGNIVQSEIPAMILPNYYVNGFSLTGTLTDITVKKGAGKDTIHQTDHNLTSSMKKTFAGWTAGDGNGGILGVTSLMANRIYYIFVIGKHGGSIVDIAFDSSTYPSLISGYDTWVIIGSFATDRSGNIALSSLFNHETYYEHGVNGTPYEFGYTSEINLDYIDFQTVEIKEMYCRDSSNSLNINVFKDFQITTNTIGSGGNLLDTVLLDGTQYYIFLATKANGIDTTAYISRNLAPSFPANYDFTRLIGAFKTESATTNINVNTLTPDEKANGKFEKTYLNVQENLAQNTVGGTATVNTFISRNLTTANKSTIPAAVVNTTFNIIILPIGVYDVHITQAIGDIEATGRLWDMTASVSLLRFTHREANHQKGSFLVCSGRFEITQKTNIEIHYYAKTSMATTDLGAPLNITGLEERYLNATFIKVK